MFYTTLFIGQYVSNCNLNPRAINYIIETDPAIMDKPNGRGIRLVKLGCRKPEDPEGNLANFDGEVFSAAAPRGDAYYKELGVLFGAKECGGCYMVEVDVEGGSTVVVHAEYEDYDNHVKRIEDAETVVEAAELRNLHLDAIKIVKAIMPVGSKIAHGCGVAVAKELRKDGLGKRARRMTIDMAKEAGYTHFVAECTGPSIEIYTGWVATEYKVEVLKKTPYSFPCEHQFSVVLVTL